MHDKDDPFFNMDDEHTIIKPNPRGRAPGQRPTRNHSGVRNQAEKSI